MHVTWNDGIFEVARACGVGRRCLGDLRDIGRRALGAMRGWICCDEERVDLMVTRVDEDKFGGEAKGRATRAVAGLVARRTSRGRSVRFTAYLSFLLKSITVRKASRVYTLHCHICFLSGVLVLHVRLLTRALRVPNCNFGRRVWYLVLAFAICLAMVHDQLVPLAQYTALSPHRDINGFVGLVKEWHMWLCYLVRIRVVPSEQRVTVIQIQHCTCSLTGVGKTRTKDLQG